jgi:hypothetical protein
MAGWVVVVLDGFQTFVPAQGAMMTSATDIVMSKRRKSG